MAYETISSPAILVPVPVTGPLSAQDVSFLQQAFQANTLEIVNARTAEKLSSDPATREFANWMLSDHLGAAPTLATLANQLGVTLPPFTAGQQAEITSLLTLSGQSFNATYAADAVSDHRQAVQLFQQEAANGQNTAVKQFAQQLVPVLEGHLNGALTLLSTITGVSQAPVTVTPPTPLPASGPALGTPSAQDVAFAQTAALTNMSEVAEGRLAESQTGNSAATQFAMWMVGDHSGAEASLQTLATQEGVTLPTTLDTAHQQELAALLSFKGSAFFAVYAAGQVIGHAHALTAFIQEAQTGQDPAIRGYAQTGVPTLATHLIGALQLAQSTPGAEAAAPVIDASLTSLLNSVAATGNTSLLNEMTQIAKLQPGFTYTPPAGSAAAAMASALSSEPSAMAAIALPH